MIQLANATLRVDVLDPVADAARLGPRFCWGAYIWQVHDADAGPLLTGPEWPNATPSAFNGQGLPESFRHRTLDGVPLTWRGERGVAIGAGELALGADGAPKVVRPCQWKIEPRSDRIVCTTRDDAAGFRHELQRTLELKDRELVSRTRLTNNADTRLALEWFAHPFFALCDGEGSAELPAGTMLAENPGFALQGRRLSQRRKFLRQEDGHMERGLRLPAEQPLVATIGHPRIRHVRFETSFAPDACIVWANDRTFSLEPYLTLDLAPGQSREWELRYRFGP